MTKKDSESIERTLVTEEMKERWKLVPKEYYPLIMAEQGRKTVEMLDNINKKVNSIYSWVLFFGLMFLLSIVLGGCYTILGS